MKSRICSPMLIQLALQMVLLTLENCQPVAVQETLLALGPVRKRNFEALLFFLLQPFVREANRSQQCSKQTLLLRGLREMRSLHRHHQGSQEHRKFLCCFTANSLRPPLLKAPLYRGMPKGVAGTRMGRSPCCLQL